MLSRACIGLVLVLIAVALAAASPTSVGRSYESGAMALPVGDPEAGRLHFMLHRCTACHRVSGDTELLAPVSAHPGPDLGAHQASLEACDLAESIIAPSHEISSEVQLASEGNLSPMGDLTETLTVRQLIDLVAYLKSLGP